jgi:hypothetical protein
MSEANWPAHRNVLSDEIILCGAAGLTSLIAVICIAYYFDVASLRNVIDGLMP